MKTSGIYSITNKINGKVYYGSSNWLKNRWIKHKSDLNKNKHGNSHLQNSWNKYGENNFEFLIIHKCPIKQLLYEEQKYLNIAKLTPKLHYNLSFNSEKKEMTEETKQKIRDKRKLQVITEEHKKKVGLFFRGRKLGHYSKERRENISKALTGRRNPQSSDLLFYTFKHTNGETFTGIRSDFYRKYNLDQSKIAKLIKKQKPQYKGWVLVL